jgi:phosphate:Na+ symporter
MTRLDNIKKEVTLMSALSLSMWKTTHQAFMEHDLDLFPKVLDDENQLNNLEKEISSELVELGRVSKDAQEKAQALIYADVAGDLELIGDYCKDILERVQIKIEEKLMFSDEAVKEYEVLYKKTEDALDEINCALERDSLDLVKQVLKNQEHIDSLVDAFRSRHNQRLIDGVCTPIACNMYLNMLDFTAAVYYHAKKIARNLLKIKQ